MLSKNSIYLLLFFPVLFISFLIYFFTSLFNSPVVGNEVAENFEARKFTQNVLSNSFAATSSFSKEYIEENHLQKEEYSEKDLEKLLNQKNFLEEKISSLVIGTRYVQTIDEVCNQENFSEKETCKKDLFIGCANSLYLGYEMAKECTQFQNEDYQKYLKAKKSVEASFMNDSVKVKLSFTNLEITNKKDEQDVKSIDEYFINSSSINNNYEIENISEQRQEREIVEEKKVLTFQTKNINYSAKALTNFWISGWGTLFAVNGGKNEAGYRMNLLTAFGYDPFDKNACIVSLPYKTIDKFFGTTLDKCVKQKNIKCIVQNKNYVKDRAIEVLMVKNGKRAIFPIGDLGPAEWTGNAIDFTRCSGNLLGATGKDLVKFRPAQKI